MRSTGSSAAPTRSSTGRGPQLQPDERRAALDEWEGELERGVATGVVGAPRDRRARPCGGRASASGGGAARRTWPRCGWTAAASGSRRVRSSSAIWTAAERRWAGSWLRSSARRPRASGSARLGVAFQLTNFLRDLREDYALDRIYLPADERELHGSAKRSRGRLGQPRAEGARRGGRPSRPRAVRRGDSRRCSRRSLPRDGGSASPAPSTAAVLDRIERNGFDVLGRATRPRLRDLARAVRT